MPQPFRTAKYFKLRNAKKGYKIKWTRHILGPQIQLNSVHTCFVILIINRFHWMTWLEKFQAPFIGDSHCADWTCSSLLHNWIKRNPFKNTTLADKKDMKMCNLQEHLWIFRHQLITVWVSYTTLTYNLHLQSSEKMRFFTEKSIVLPTI